jgi:hypothetical protein
VREIAQRRLSRADRALLRRRDRTWRVARQSS